MPRTPRRSSGLMRQVFDLMLGARTEILAAVKVRAEPFLPRPSDPFPLPPSLSWVREEKGLVKAKTETK